MNFFEHPIMLQFDTLLGRLHSLLLLLPPNLDFEIYVVSKIILKLLSVSSYQPQKTLRGKKYIQLFLNYIFKGYIGQ